MLCNNTALIFPPTCDPTAPYISIPTLAGFLRSHGKTVLSFDANVEGWHSILTTRFLENCANTVEKKIFALEQHKRLNHQQQLLLTQLWGSLPFLKKAPQNIREALSTFQTNSHDRFYDAEQYNEAVIAAEQAQTLISAAFAPLQLNFSQYRTPFSLLGMSEIARDARPENNPFHEYYLESLIPRLKNSNVIGISVIFPSQIQQAHALSLLIREHIPAAHLTVGGPAITQLLLRIPESERESALGSFQSAILFEGETALLNLIEDFNGGKQISRIIFGEQSRSLHSQPAPDYEGLPMHLYLSPELVLSYDPTRGCYWGKCAFCHYGLAKTGTAKYRERSAKEAAQHLSQLSKKWNSSVFHLSQDAFAPVSAQRLATALIESDVKIKWVSDIRPEAALTPELCATLAKSGALAFSFGVESASDRVLSKINKGVSVATIQAAVDAAATNGIAVEAMCFTDFPEENSPDAMATIKFVSKNKSKLSLFICGEFHLVSGSAVAANPKSFGISETWSAEGDTFRTNLFFCSNHDWKTDAEREIIDRELSSVSMNWRLNHYPWAGSLSTAHTLLWYQKHGLRAFQTHNKGVKKGTNRNEAAPVIRSSRFNIPKIAAESAAFESEIWSHLTHNLRNVSRDKYESISQKLPSVHPRATRVSVSEDGEFDECE